MDEVVTEIKGSLGIITLNRPQALNALNIGMIRSIAQTLDGWKDDYGVRAVLFLGAGERAFCAGGDLKGFHKAGMDYRSGAITGEESCAFFEAEYGLNRQIFHYPKPTIAFMNGITMGGGYGIAGNCSVRIATDKTIFAMPEVGIGFFPDVGSIYHLLRAPRNFGKYLALSGRQIAAGDMLAAKLADCYTSGDLQGDVVRALAETNGEDVEARLRDVLKKPPVSGIFALEGKLIERVFAEKNVAGIIAALTKEGSPWALELAQFLKSRSPTSVLVTAEYLRRMEGADFDAVITADLGLARGFLDCPDFYEGIRAAVIDKDRNPQWNPADFGGVSEAVVQGFFEN